MTRAPHRRKKGKRKGRENMERGRENETDSDRKLRRKGTCKSKRNGRTG